MFFRPDLEPGMSLQFISVAGNPCNRTGSVMLKESIDMTNNGYRSIVDSLTEAIYV